MLSEKAANNSLLKLKQLLEVILVVSVFCLIFLFTHKALFDLDIWLHLKTGEYILQNKTIPFHDIFSFTLQGKNWVDHSWLFQIISYLIYSVLQADGLILFECIVIGLSFFVLFLMGYRLINSYLETGILLVILALASLSRFNLRPDMFSVLFFSVYLYILSLYADRKALWFLLPIQILWVNIHGYFFLGPLLVLFFIIAESLRRKITIKAYRRLQRLFLVLLFACLINPRGLQGALYPVFVTREFLSGRAKIFLQYIQELQPTFNFTKGLGKFYYLLAIPSFVLMIINLKRLKVIDILLFVFFFLFSLSHRNMLFFLFVCFKIIISYSAPLLKIISSKVKNQDYSKQALFLLFKCLTAIVLIGWIVLKIDQELTQNYYDFEAKEFKSSLMDIDQRGYPVKAVDFILKNDLPGNMFNDFNSGAYLIGKAYPKRRVFIDGRTEVYGPDFFKEYMMALKKDITAFDGIVDRYKITAVLVTMGLTPMPDVAGYLYRSPHWQLVFFDDKSAIFLKDVPMNQELIKKYKIDLAKYSTPKFDLKELRLKAVFPLPYVKRASLFDVFQEDKLVIAECNEALRIMPDCAQAFYFLGKVYLRKGIYEQALQNLRSSVLMGSGNIEGLVYLGICYKELGEGKLAKNILKRAIRIDKRYALAYYHLGCVYLMDGNDREAINLLKQAVKYEQGEEPKYHFKLAEALYESALKSKDNSDILKAKASLARAQELNLRYRDSELSKAARDLGQKIENITKSTPIQP